ncbi:MAG: TonB-dependent receptor [Saprospiraceae bacterium]|nr:TonB-dependent receptor [Saprospiraceae bacterium]MCF8248770.1 TonB-dependent receptor [Saprospiraceae bacterium]MCF8278740.1 TonB-dependent receptor [Bacteroidales bacterium]MCF8310540.1 TonB-dependent receptor [Saprospiraceae bacterium]MCF8439099.1 TonB-dependent receptor [Saprospiraceae bacterium]
MPNYRIIILFFLCYFWVNSLLAQNTLPTLSANFRNTDFHTAIAFFEKNYPVSFSYDDDAVEGVRVTAVFRNFELPDAMKRLLKGTGLTFEIIDNQYILIKKLNAESQPMPPIPQFPNSPIPALALCGTILDAETNEPLPGATAYIKNTPHGTVTEADGKFKLEGSFTKDDSLIVSYLGYKQQAHLVRPLLVKKCQDYRLRVDVMNIPDVLIQDFATDMIKLADEGGFHFDKQKMPTLPGWGEPDVLRSLQLLPGISAADESGSRLNVRGGTPDQNLVLLDGIPIYHTGHFFGLYDAFNPFIVDEVDVWRGNFGAEYGGRNSSVIDIAAKQGYGKKTSGGIGMNLLSLQGYVDIPLKKDRVSLLIALRRSYIDGLQSTAYKSFFNQIFQNGKIALQEQAVNDSKFITWNPAISFGDANLKLRWKGKKTAENALSFYNTNDQLNYRFAFDDSTFFTETEDIIAASNFGMSWQHSAQWSPVFDIKYSAALSAYKNDYTFIWNEEDRLRPFIYRYTTNNSMGEFDLNLHHNWKISDRHRASFGYQLKVQEASIVFRDTNAVTLTGNLSTNDTVRTGLHTFYAEFAWQATQKLDLTLGIRENLFPERGLYYSEPRLGFNWFPFGKKADGSNFRLKGGLGRYWQFVFQIIDFGDLGVGEPLWALADENIPAQELWQTSFGLSMESKTALLDMEIYRKKNRNLTSLNLRLENSFDRGFNFDGESTATGFDFLLRKRWHRFSTWLAYSLGEVQTQFPELNGGKSFPARHDVRHRLNWVNTLSWKNWEFAANLNLRSGTPYSIPSVVQKPCPDCTADTFTYALAFDQLNTARLPGSVRLDLSATWKWKKRRNHGKVGLAVYNFTNRRNLLDKDYLLETPALDQPQTTYNLKELYRLAAGATPSIFVMTEW